MHLNRSWLRIIFLIWLSSTALAACSKVAQPASPSGRLGSNLAEPLTAGGQPLVETKNSQIKEPDLTALSPEPEQIKSLTICMTQEPNTLYPYGGNMLAATAVRAALFEKEITTFQYDWQPRGIEKLPYLHDGDAALDQVEVKAGDLVLDSSGSPTILAAGVEVITSAGEKEIFDGSPLMMDQLTANFTLKERTWADGQPVTAVDSLFSFTLNADPDTPASKFLTDRTQSYKITGRLRLRWTGLPGFMDATYFTNVWPPLPQHAWGHFSAAELLNAKEANRLPIGDGPFKIDAWNPGEQIVLSRNEYYYRRDEGFPLLDTVTIKFIADTNQLVAQLISGLCDIVTQDGLDASQSHFLIEAETNDLLVTYFQTGTVFEHIDFGINSYGDYGDDLGRPDWFEDRRVRQAMTLCTDRQGMVDHILFGRSEVVHTFVPRMHPLYPETGITQLPYDVEAANALLDDAGYLDNDGDGIREYPGGKNGVFQGTPFRITLGTTTGNEMRHQITQIFKENMRACGIDITLYYVPASEWFADGPDGPLFGRRYDLGEFAWISGPQPACHLYLTSNITGPASEGFGGWGNTNNTGWSNQKYDAACFQALGSLPGTPEYEAAHRTALQIFSEEVPVIPIFLRLIVAAARPEVKGLSVDPTGGTELINIYQFDIE